MLRILDIQRAIAAYEGTRNPGNDSSIIPEDFARLVCFFTSLPNKEALGTRALSSKEYVELLGIINSRKSDNTADSDSCFKPLLTLMDQLSGGNVQQYLAMARQGELTMANRCSILNPLNEQDLARKKFILTIFQKLDLLTQVNIDAVNDLNSNQLLYVAQILECMNKDSFGYSSVAVHMINQLAQADVSVRQRIVDILLEHKNDKCITGERSYYPRLFDRMGSVVGYQCPLHPKQLERALENDERDGVDFLTSDNEVIKTFRNVKILARSAIAQSVEHKTHLFRHLMSAGINDPLDSDIRRYLYSDNKLIVNAARAAICLSLLTLSHTTTCQTMVGCSSVFKNAHFLDFSGSRFINRYPSETDWKLICELICVLNVESISFHGSQLPRLTVGQWQRFLTALKKSRISELVMVDTDLFAIPEECQPVLLDIARLPQLTRLAFAGCEAKKNVTFFNQFLRALVENKNIRELDLSHCVTNGMYGVTPAEEVAIFTNLKQVLEAGQVRKIKMPTAFKQTPEAATWSQFCAMVQSDKLRSLDMTKNTAAFPYNEESGVPERWKQFIGALENSSITKIKLMESVPRLNADIINYTGRIMSNNFHVVKFVIQWYKDELRDKLVNIMSSVVERNKAINDLLASAEQAVKQIAEKPAILSDYSALIEGLELKIALLKMYGSANALARSKTIAECRDRLLLAYGFQQLFHADLVQTNERGLEMLMSIAPTSPCYLAARLHVFDFVYTTTCASSNMDDKANAFLSAVDCLTDQEGQLLVLPGAESPLADFVRNFDRRLVEIATGQKTVQNVDMLLTHEQRCKLLTKIATNPTLNLQMHGLFAIDNALKASAQGIGSANINAKP